MLKMLRPSLYHVQMGSSEEHPSGKVTGEAALIYGRALPDRWGSSCSHSSEARSGQGWGAAGSRLLVITG